MGEIEAVGPGYFPLAWEETEAARIEGWRLGELLRVGYPVRVAEHLAKDFTVDLHAACEILDQGCSPELAEAILT